MAGLVPAIHAVTRTTGFRIKQRLLQTTGFEF
jgi:hypothetical protein